MIQHGMDLTDSLILRWFIDFKDTHKMYSEYIKDDIYYWIKYEALLKDIPIINIGKVALGRRLKKLSQKNILKQYIKKKAGTFSLYAIGDRYIELISQGVKLSSQEGIDSKVQPNNSSSNNSSTNQIMAIDDFFNKAWLMYRRKEGKGSISKTQKSKLFKLGDEFIRCIERYNKKLDKDGTERKYTQQGSRFFNSGYVDYLDENYNIEPEKSQYKDLTGAGGGEW